MDYEEFKRDYYTLPEAAKALGFSWMKVYQLRKRGIIKTQILNIKHQKSGLILISKSELIKLDKNLV